MVAKFSESLGSSQGLLRIGLLTVAALLTAFLGYGIWRALEREQDRSTAPGSAMDAAMQLSQMDYTEMENERRVWTLHTETAAYYQDQQKSVLADVRMVFFLEDGREIRLRSSHGTLFIDSKNLELWGLVQLEMPEGYTIHTDKVSYRHQQHLVVSDTPTTLNGPELTLTGETFEYDIADQRGSLNGAVRAVMDPSKLQRQADAAGS